jgi:hypothetical protein
LLRAAFGTLEVAALRSSAVPHADETRRTQTTRAAAVTAIAAAMVLGATAPAHAGFSSQPGLTPLPGALAAPTPIGVPAAEGARSGRPQRYGTMDRPSCEAELQRRAIPFLPLDQARGVTSPIRLTGPLHGVTFAASEPEAQRATSPLEILDCRLALALDDFADQLASHDIVRVVHFSMYRPPPRGWPADRAGSRHAGALAIDAAAFVKRDGTRLDVVRDFHGRIGARTCGPGAGPSPATPEALELRQIVCDAAGARLFNVALTPDFNWPHRNHFHLEVKAGVDTLFLH